MRIAVKVLLLVCRLTLASADLKRLESCTSVFNDAYFDAVSGRCYYFSNVQNTAENDQSTFCQGDESCCGEGRPVRIDNAHIFHNIFMEFSQDDEYGKAVCTENGCSYNFFWLGIDRINSNNFQFFGTDTDIDKYYTAWKPGEPDHNDGTALCAAGNYDGIRTLPCSREELYLCESEEFDTGCPLGFFWYRTTAKCYMIRDDEKRDFQTARRLCYDHGAEPYMPNANYELGVIADFKFDDSFWVGLTDLVREDHFFWVNGHRMERSFWVSGQPDNSGNEDCVELLSDDKKIHDSKCSNGRYYACQKPTVRESERGGCPGDSWRYVETGRCYTWYRTTSVMKSEAKQFCGQKDGFLAAPPDGLEDRFQRLVDSFNTNIWYNGSNVSDSTYGTPLCEFNPPQGSCPDGYFKHDYLNSCFKIEMKEIKTWDNARADCQSSGGDLIKIDSQKVQDFVAISTTRTHWIGANRQGSRFYNEVNWVKDNKPLSSGYTSWCNSEPNTRLGRDKCVAFFDENHAKHGCFHNWFVAQCWLEQGYICQYDIQ